MCVDVIENIKEVVGEIKEVGIVGNEMKTSSKQKKEAPYFLVVGTDPKKRGGCGKKYPTYEEAVAGAKRFLHHETKDCESLHICKPIALVELESRPVKVTPI